MAAVPKWLSIFAVVTLAALAVGVPSIPQRQDYHQFADQRHVVRHVPNTLNVLSNAAILAAGVAGLFFTSTRRSIFLSRLERTDARMFFIGTTLTAIGSAIYHLRPSDATLVYDRMGMSVAFMAFLAMTVHERWQRWPWLLPAFLAVGVASVLWWRAFDDLRLYGWVQYFPIIAIVALLVAERQYDHEVTAIAGTLFAYAAAKCCELADELIFEALDRTVSGHTLKHLFAGAGALILVYWIAKRRALVLSPSRNSYSGRGNRQRDSDVTNSQAS